MSSNSAQDDSVAVNTKAMTAIHSTMVFVSRSLKKAPARPFHTSA